MKKIAISFVLLLAVVAGLSLSNTGTVAASQVLANPNPITCGQTITESVKLTSDLLNCPGNGIIIGADNITLDGNGHLLSGEKVEGSSGVYLDGKHGVTVKSLQLTGFEIGLSMSNSEENTISKNVFSDNNLSILLSSSSNNMIEMNNFSRHFRGIWLLSSSNENDISENMIKGSASTAAIYLNNTSGNVIRENTITNAWRGIELFESNNNAVFDNILIENRHEGIFLNSSSQNFVKKNDVSRQGNDAYRLLSSNNNTFYKNHAENNSFGFKVDLTSAGNVFKKNDASNNYGGYIDMSLGNGTSGTANTYDKNICNSNRTFDSSPLGLCMPNS